MIIEILILIIIFKLFFYLHSKPIRSIGNRQNADFRFFWTDLEVSGPHEMLVRRRLHLSTSRRHYYVIWFD